VASKAEEQELYGVLAQFVVVVVCLTDFGSYWLDFVGQVPLLSVDVVLIGESLKKPKELKMSHDLGQRCMESSAF
jgi:hypothetical protein